MPVIEARLPEIGATIARFNPTGETAGDLSSDQPVVIAGEPQRASRLLFPHGTDAAFQRVTGAWLHGTSGATAVLQGADGYAYVAPVSIGARATGAPVPSGIFVRTAPSLTSIGNKGGVGVKFCGETVALSGLRMRGPLTYRS